MKRIPSLHAGLSSLLVALVFGAMAPASWAQTQVPVVIPNAQNPELVQNQEVADAQGVNVITTFMTSGTQTCNSQGQDCTGDFGSDDSVNYLNMQAQAQAATGVQGYSFMGGDSETDSDDVSTQQGTLEIACGDISPHMVSGIAVKATYCTVDAAGDATVTMQVCTGPSRGNSVSVSPNTVQCSSNPGDPTFFPPAGYACARPVCDTEPVDSENGWSSPFNIVFMATLPPGATSTQQSQNGLGLTFYPPLSSGTTASLTTDAQSMTAVQIVETAINTQTQRTAVAMNIAFRSETSITATELASNTTTGDPSSYSDSWDDVLRLQANPLYAQYSGQDEANGTACLNQIYAGIQSTSGTVYVCDPTYNQNGVTAHALSAQVGTQGENCGTTQQCLSQVVNTTSWTQQCVADMPLAIASCETTTAYTMDQIGLTANQVTEVCQETRGVAQYTCQTSASPGTMTNGCAAGQACSLVPTCTPGQTFQVQTSSPSGQMGNDFCNGGDDVQANWTCPNDPSQMPSISLSTDSKESGTVSVVVPNNSSVVAYIGDSQGYTADDSCYGQFSNQTTCVNGQCTGTFTMELGDMVCPVAESCTEVDTGEQDMEGNEIYDDECTCPQALAFRAQSFGSAESITTTGNFSLAQLMGSTVTDGCSAYEAAE